MNLAVIPARGDSKRITTLRRHFVLHAHGMTISMDGKGHWVNNVFVERQWRSVKYEGVYLRRYEAPAALRTGPTCYFTFYNTERVPQTLTDRHPMPCFFVQTQVETAA